MCSGTQTWEIKVIKIEKHIYSPCKNGRQTLSKATVLNLDCEALKTLMPHIQSICFHWTGVQPAILILKAHLVIPVSSKDWEPLFWRDIASTWATQDPHQAWLRKQNLTTPKGTIHQEQAEITKNRINSPRTLKITELFVIDYIILYGIWSHYIIILDGIWSHHLMGNRWGDSGNTVRLHFFGLQNHCGWWLQPWN